MRLRFTSHRDVRIFSAGHYYRFFGKELDDFIYGKIAEYCGEIFDEKFIFFLQKVVMNSSQYVSTVWRTAESC